MELPLHTGGQQPLAPRVEEGKGKGGFQDEFDALAKIRFGYGTVKFDESELEFTSPETKLLVSKSKAMAAMHFRLLQATRYRRKWKQLILYVLFLTVYFTSLVLQHSREHMYAQETGVRQKLSASTFVLDDSFRGTANDVRDGEDLWAWMEQVFAPNFVAENYNSDIFRQQLILGSLKVLGGVLIKQTRSSSATSECYDSPATQLLGDIACSGGTSTENFGSYTYDESIEGFGDFVLADTNRDGFLGVVDGYKVDFFDEHTRSISLHFDVYSGDSNLFTHVDVSFNFHLSQKVEFLYSLRSVKLFMFISAWDWVRVSAEVVVFVTVMAFLISSLRFSNLLCSTKTVFHRLDRSKAEYLSSQKRWMRLRLLSYFLYVVSTIIYMVFHLYVAFNGPGETNSSFVMTPTTYQEGLKTFVLIFDIYTVFAALTAVVMALSLLSYTIFHRQVGLFGRLIGKLWLPILSVCLLFVVSVIVHAFAAFVIFGWTSEEYSTFKNAFLSVLKISVLKSDIGWGDENATLLALLTLSVLTCTIFATGVLYSAMSDYVETSMTKSFTHFHFTAPMIIRTHLQKVTSKYKRWKHLTDEEIYAALRSPLLENEALINPTMLSKALISQHSTVWPRDYMEYILRYILDTIQKQQHMKAEENKSEIQRQLNTLQQHFSGIEEKADDLVGNLQKNVRDLHTLEANAVSLQGLLASQQKVKPE